jgi:hypothetical protein
MLRKRFNTWSVVLTLFTGISFSVASAEDSPGRKIKSFQTVSDLAVQGSAALSAIPEVVHRVSKRTDELKHQLNALHKTWTEAANVDDDVKLAEINKIKDELVKLQHSLIAYSLFLRNDLRFYLFSDLEHVTGNIPSGFTLPNMPDAAKGPLASGNARGLLRAMDMTYRHNHLGNLLSAGIGLEAAWTGLSRLYDAHIESEEYLEIPEAQSAAVFTPEFKGPIAETAPRFLGFLQHIEQDFQWGLAQYDAIEKKMKASLAMLKEVPKLKREAAKEELNRLMTAVMALDAEYYGITLYLSDTISQEIDYLASGAGDFNFKDTDKRINLSTPAPEFGYIPEKEMITFYSEVDRGDPAWIQRKFGSYISRTYRKTRDTIRRSIDETHSEFFKQYSLIASPLKENGELLEGMDFYLGNMERAVSTSSKLLAEIDRQSMNIQRKSWHYLKLVQELGVVEKEAEEDNFDELLKESPVCEKTYQEIILGETLFFGKRNPDDTRSDGVAGLLLDLSIVPHSMNSMFTFSESVFSQYLNQLGEFSSPEVDAMKARVRELQVKWKTVTLNIGVRITNLVKPHNRMVTAYQQLIRAYMICIETKHRYLSANRGRLVAKMRFPHAGHAFACLCLCCFKTSGFDAQRFPGYPVTSRF